MIAPWKVYGQNEWRFPRFVQNSRRAENPGYATLALL